MRNAVRSALNIGALACLVVTVAACRRHHRVPTVDYAAVLKALAGAGRPALAATAVQSACQTADQACRCAEMAARAALDADLQAAAIRVLDSAPHACKNAESLAGERAEALARAGQSDTAQHAAEVALGVGATNQYAELALARVAYDKNEMTSCHDHAAKALQFGRGSEAARLLGRSALARGALAEASGYFKQVLAADPGDVEAAFSVGICADKLGNYLEAREAFLQTLRIDPKHVPSRVSLIMLTLNAGATDEARHNLRKLQEILPSDDPELKQLEQFLAIAEDGGVPAKNPLMVQGKR